MEKVHESQQLPASVVDETGEKVPHGDALRRAARTLVVDSNGDIIDSFGGPGSGSTAIKDGVDSDIKATVLDLPSSDPLTVAVVDANGDQVTGFGVGLTDTELRAVPVDVLGPLTDTELRADPVPMGLSTYPSPVTVTGDITATDEAVVIELLGYQGLGCKVAGAGWSGVLWAEFSVDGGVSYGASPAPVFNYTTGATQTAIQANVNAVGMIINSGATHFRLRAQGAWSGTANITITKTATAFSTINPSQGIGTSPNYVTQVGGPFSSTPTILLACQTASSVPSAGAIGWVVRQVPEISSRSDTYTAAANGTTVNVSTHSRQYFSIQVTGTGAAASAWDVVLEGSLNNTNWSTILNHTTATGDGAVLWLATRAPSLYFRSRCVSVTLGSATNIVVAILGKY